MLNSLNNCLEVVLRKILLLVLKISDTGPSNLLQWNLTIVLFSHCFRFLLKMLCKLNDHLGLSEQPNKLNNCLFCKKSAAIEHLNRTNSTMLRAGREQNYDGNMLQMNHILVTRHTNIPQSF